MQLKLNLSGSADPLINWLKKFDKIRPSLLIEIDTNLRALVAKTSLEDKSGVRYSSILMDDANICILSDDGESTRNGDRIKLAVVMQLPKFIKIIERLSDDVDEDGNVKFNIEIDYDKRIDPNKHVADFVATSIKFVTEKLTMRMDGFRTDDLFYITDDMFVNNLFNVNRPFTCNLSAAECASIIKTSDIIKVDGRNDALVFYNEGKKLLVRDRQESGKESTMVLCVGEFEQEPDYEISATIRRSNFVRMIDKTDEDYKVILGIRDRGGKEYVDRILFDSLSSPTKVVISILSV